MGIQFIKWFADVLQILTTGVIFIIPMSECQVLITGCSLLAQQTCLVGRQACRPNKQRTHSAQHCHLWHLELSFSILPSLSVAFCFYNLSPSKMTITTAQIIMLSTPSTLRLFLSYLGWNSRILQLFCSVTIQLYNN